MYKKSASALIVTVFILLIADVIALGLIKYQINSIQSCSMNFDKQDIYNINENEEEFLYKSMKKLNKVIEEKDLKDCLPITEGSFSLEFNDDSKDIFLVSPIGEGNMRKRKIEYKYKDNKIILIPTQFYI